jgi:hypothetical protein
MSDATAPHAPNQGQAIAALATSILSVAGRSSASPSSSDPWPHSWIHLETQERRHPAVLALIAFVASGALIMYGVWSMGW